MDAIHTQEKKPECKEEAADCTAFHTKPEPLLHAGSCEERNPNSCQYGKDEQTKERGGDAKEVALLRIDDAPTVHHWVEAASWLVAWVLPDLDLVIG